MLSIRHLGHRYPGAAADALTDVTLHAARGQVLGLLGPNGAGKTTLISHLTGGLAVQRGEVLVDGLPLAQVRAAQPTRIAVAPQELAFYPMLTVAQNLACFAGAAGLAGAQRAARMQACIATAQMERHVHARADQLSGGLKRRLNLAIALLPQPELIVFDEPTVGVDPQTRAFVLDAIQRLARDGAAVIYTSHYMDEIEAIADRVLIIDHGRVLRDGALSELLAEGATLLTVSASGLSPAALHELLGRYGSIEAGAAADLASGHTVRLRLTAATTPVGVLQALQAAGAVVQHADFGRCNLEQLFMALTQRPLRD